MPDFESRPAAERPTEPLNPMAAVLTRRTIAARDGVPLSLVIARPGGAVAADPTVPPILAIHGFASSAVGGWGRTGHLDALTRSGRIVVAIDLRGHGESGKPHDALAYTLAAVLADIVAAAAAAEPARRDTVEAPIDVIGYSLGSRLAWTISCRGLVNARRMVLGGFDGRPLFDGVDTGRLERLAASAPDGDPVALRALIAGLAGTGGAPEIGPLPIAPTLVVAGLRDELATGAARFAAGLPRGEFLPIPGRDHISAVPARAYREAVVEFLAR